MDEDLRIKINYWIYNYPSKNDFGLTRDEYIFILNKFKEANKESFFESLNCNNCEIGKDGEIVHYYDDVKLALKIALSQKDTV